MATEAKLRQLADKGCPVYYFYSTERYLVRQAVNAAVRVLSADSDEDATVLDGAAPEIEGLIMAAGTISFLAPAAWWCCRRWTRAHTAQRIWMSCAVRWPAWKMRWWCWAVCSHWSAASSRPGNRPRNSFAQCKAIGYVEELAKPRPFELKAMMIDRTKAQGTSLPDGAAAALLEAAARIHFCWKTRWTSSVRCPATRP